MLLAGMALMAPPAIAAEPPLRVAVASNFSGTLAEITASYSDETGDEVSLSSASTGTLYAQIERGAPFDLFLAADTARPDKLVVTGKAVAGSRFVYARGALALYSRDLPLAPDPSAVLAEGTYRHLAMADPKTAPYGTAAHAVLEGTGILEQVASRLVYGKNISQTFQLVATGHATLGFVALSQLEDPDNPLGDGGHIWQPPASLYPPLDQAAVLLEHSTRKATARRFLRFLRSEAAQAIIERHGYTVPPPDPS